MNGVDDDYKFTWTRPKPLDRPITIFIKGCASTRQEVQNIIDAINAQLKPDWKVNEIGFGAENLRVSNRYGLDYARQMGKSFAVESAYGKCPTPFNYWLDESAPINKKDWIHLQQGGATMARKKQGKRSRTLGQALLSGDIRFAGQVEVRGGHYHDMWEAKVDGKLDEGAWLGMKREPSNQYDSNCIAVYAGKQKIGVVAKEKAAELAPYMDIGVRMALRVLSHSPAGEPLRLVARLYIKK